MYMYKVGVCKMTDCQHDPDFLVGVSPSFLLYDIAVATSTRLLHILLQCTWQTLMNNATNVGPVYPHSQ